MTTATSTAIKRESIKHFVTQVRRYRNELLKVIEDREVFLMREDGSESLFPIYATDALKEGVNQQFDELDKQVGGLILALQEHVS